MTVHLKLLNGGVEPSKCHVPQQCSWWGVRLGNDNAPALWCSCYPPFVLRRLAERFLQTIETSYTVARHSHMLGMTGNTWTCLGVRSRSCGLCGRFSWLATLHELHLQEA